MRTLSGNRFIDRTLFGLGLLILLMVAPRLRVYHRDSPTEVGLVAVTKDGTRLDLPTPASFRDRQPELFSTVRRIRAFTQTEEGQKLIPPDGRWEWSLHYQIPRRGTDAVWQLVTPETD